jgi:hypothetical protein
VLGDDLADLEAKNRTGELTISVDIPFDASSTPTPLQTLELLAATGASSLQEAFARAANGTIIGVDVDVDENDDAFFMAYHFQPKGAKPTAQAGKVFARANLNEDAPLGAVIARIADDRFVDCTVFGTRR